MSKEERIAKTIENFHLKCQSIEENKDFIAKLKIHEEFIIASILEELIED